MSEIQDAAQIIKVSFEGAEIILKMGNTGWQFVKDICAVFKKVLDQEKLSGKTSVQKLLKMGGDLQVFRFETKDLERVKALANKYGIGAGISYDKILQMADTKNSAEKMKEIRKKFTKETASD